MRVGIVLGAAGRGRGQLVHEAAVVGLLEGVDEHLPVAVHVGLERVHALHGVERKVLDLLAETAQVQGQRRGGRIDGHENEAGEGLAAQRRQAQLAAVQIEEHLLVGHEHALPGRVVGPAVKAARETLGIAAALGHLVAAVAAHVVKGPHLAVVTAHQDDRGPQDGNVLDHVRRPDSGCPRRDPGSARPF